MFEQLPAPFEIRTSFLSRSWRALSTVSSCLLTAALFAGIAAGQTNWTLVWSDEFNGPAGAAPDPGKWTYDTGGGGFGNGEIEIYCAPGSNASPCVANNPNIFQDGNGNLVIQARLNNGP
jgi:hypothetical protein